jgi:hypothetical protein
MHSSFVRAPCRSALNKPQALVCIELQLFERCFDRRGRESARPRPAGNVMVGSYDDVTAPGLTRSTRGLAVAEEVTSYSTTMTGVETQGGGTGPGVSIDDDDQFASAGTLVAVWMCLFSKRDSLEETLAGTMVCVLTPLWGSLGEGGGRLFLGGILGNEKRDGNTENKGRKDSGARKQPTRPPEDK